MRLYLAFAVVMLAFVAYTEAQDLDHDQVQAQAQDQAQDQVQDHAQDHDQVQDHAHEEVHADAHEEVHAEVHEEVHAEAHEEVHADAHEEVPAHAQEEVHAHEEGQTIKQRFTHFGEQVAEVSKNLAEKAKMTFEDMQSGKFTTDSRDWIQTQIDNLKAKLA